jgi:hypothetical protein
MMALAAAHPLVIAVSYHSAGRFIDYPYACSSGLPSEIMPEHDVIHEMMNSMADAIDAVDAVPRYSVFSPASAGALSGDDTSWYYAEKGVYSFIVEVGTSFEPPFSEVAGIVDRNRAGWQELYQRLEGARIDVHVADAGTGQPLEAEVALLDYVYDTGEAPRWTHMPFGRFTYLVPGSDTYTVRASRPGYVTRDVAVAVGMAPEELTIALELVGGPSQVPALSTLALGLLGLLFLAGGAVAVRRQTA